MNSSRRGRGPVLGIIPARGGSKGIAGKNLQSLGGRTLLECAILAGRESGVLDALVVSTDSEEIADVARAAGVPVPRLRPRELATDEASTTSVILHEVEIFEMDMGCEVEMVLILQPTTPLRTAEDVSRVVDLLMNSPQAEGAITGYDATSVHPRIMYLPDPEGASSQVRPLTPPEDSKQWRRQDFPRTFVRNGAVYAVRRKFLFQEQSILPERPLLLEMPRFRSVNIDQPEDLLWAEFLLQRGLGGHDG